MQPGTNTERDLLAETTRILLSLSEAAPACELRILELLRRSLMVEIDAIVAEVRKGEQGPEWMREAMEGQGVREPWVVASPSEKARGKYVVEAHGRLSKLSAGYRRDAKKNWRNARVAALQLEPFLKIAKQLSEDVLAGREDEKLSRPAVELLHTRMGTFLES